MRASRRRPAASPAPSSGERSLAALKLEFPPPSRRAERLPSRSAQSNSPRQTTGLQSNLAANYWLASTAAQAPPLQPCLRVQLGGELDAELGRQAPGRPLSNKSKALNTASRRPLCAYKAASCVRLGAAVCLWACCRLQWGAGKGLARVFPLCSLSAFRSSLLT